MITWGAKMAAVELFKYVVTIFYVVLVYWLSWIGMRRTKSMSAFSVGNKDMSPYIVGITLAASIASSATFVINPGFVYVHGLSAFLHYGIAGSLGILTAFLLLSRGFLKLGARNKALTIPDWIYHRYQHRGLSLFFALINLLSITFVVLILVGCSLLMAGLFPIDQKAALVLVLLFVFSYVLMGGTYAHAYTNTMQGLMMLVVTAFLFVHGLQHFDDGFFDSLKSVGQSYASIYNSESNLYYDFFSVFGSGFIVTFALMLQPHIFTKVLYLKSEADIGKFIGTTVVVGTVFSFVLMIGFYAKLSGVNVVTQDQTVVAYLLTSFSGSLTGELVIAFIFITLLAAGMSTLDGILVSLSAMVVNDLVLPLGGKVTSALTWSRCVLVGVGFAALAIAWNPPELIGLFAQKGVYGLAAASVVPILFGVLYKNKLSIWVIWGSSLLGIATHFYLNLFAGVSNPAVSSSYGILLSIAFALVASIISLKFKHRSG